MNNELFIKAAIVAGIIAIIRAVMKRHHFENENLSNIDSYFDDEEFVGWLNECND